ncbi:hypothetical protein L3X38_037287 [Prunus dulcis]|uniref:Uncharacterized protein n=1 Tax=Prunus dulcis TaxID=3755 RepID=A0AAD4V2T8_PRUDU|nr:hypothetical protein L3X38_037287 [Prunus dulcis]
MVSADPSPIIRDHLHSLDDQFKRGWPPPLLKSAGEDIGIDGEPVVETTPVIDTASISRLLPTTVRHSRLVSEEKAISLSEKQNLPFTSKSGEIVGTPKIKGKPKEATAIPKRRNMRILQTRFAGTRKGNGENSGPKVVVTVDDDDDGSGEDDAAETGISTHEQKSIRDINGMDEDLDEDQYYSCDEGTYLDPYTHLKEPDALGMPPEFASDPHNSCPASLSHVMPTVENTTDRSPEAGLVFPAAVTDTMQAAGKVESTSQGEEDTLPTPLLGTPNAATDIALHLPAVLPLAHPLGTPDAATDTALHLLAVLPPTPPFLGTSDVAAGTAPQLPTVPPRGEITDDSYKAGDASVTETVAVLRKFMDKYGSFMEITRITSSFSRSATFRALGLVLHGTDTMQLLDIIDHRLLCWQDAICEAITLGFLVDFLLNLVRNLAHAVFGAHAIYSMKSSLGFDEVKAAADTLNIKQGELEDQRRELHALLLTKGVSADSVECMAEAAARSSPRASSVLFGHSS